MDYKKNVMAFCKKASSKIKAFLKKVNDLLINKADIGIKVVQQIKAILDGSIVKTVVSLTPTQWDDNMRDLAVDALNKALVKLGMFAVKDANSLQLLVDQIGSMTKDKRAAMYLKLASLILSSLDGEKEENHLYDLVTQARYSELK